jgi:6-phosphofructokinase 1
VQSLLAHTNDTDASGNPVLADIGRHLRKVLKAEIARADVKYIDPTYMIRAIATCSQDRIYCKILAHNAVHGAFAGFTGARRRVAFARHALHSTCSLVLWHT